MDIALEGLAESKVNSLTILLVAVALVSPPALKLFRPLGKLVQNTPYEEGLDVLLEGEWEQAERAFAAILAEPRDDPALRLMGRRCSTPSALPCPAGGDPDQTASTTWTAASP